MARGVCYCVANSAESAADIDFDNVTASVSDDETDYFYEENDEEAVANLLACLQNHGAIIGEEDGVKYFMVNDQMKRNFFFKNYEEFLCRSRTLTIDEFALDDPYKLKMLIDDPFSDGVYDPSEGFRTLDKYIRLTEPGKKYFIKNAYCMH